MRVLVIEDEKRLAATLGDLLEMDGYTADLCYDGESGLDNALTGIYDVILLDMMLPKKDGLTVLRELRENGNATPVLMLTARSELSDRVAGLDSGADYYLYKLCQYSYDKSRRDRGNFDFPEFKGKSADARYKYSAHDKQIFGFAKIYSFEHFKTADRDKSVKCYADTADDAVRNRIYKRYERLEEGKQHCHY